MGSARLKQLGGALARKPQHPTRLAHRQIRAANQVGRHLGAGGRRLRLQDLSFIATEMTRALDERIKAPWEELASTMAERNTLGRIWVAADPSRLSLEA